MNDPVTHSRRGPGVVFSELYRLHRFHELNRKERLFGELIRDVGRIITVERSDRSKSKTSRRGERADFHLV